MTNIACILKLSSITFYIIQAVYNYLYPLESSYTKHHLISFSHFLGSLFSHASSYLFTILLIFIAQGYTLIFSNSREAYVQSKAVFMEMSIPIAIAIGILKLLSLGYAVNDTYGNGSIYSGIFGSFLMALKFFQWLFFEYSLYETSGCDALVQDGGVIIRGSGSR